jgi:hypothetical protein
MPAIEKICELSGDYPSWEMYGYKQHHIQIMPEHRHRFRGIKAELVFTSIEGKICYRGPSGSLYSTFPCMMSLIDDFKCDVDAWWADHQYYDDHFLRFEYQYELRVSDPELQGRVNGIYKNWSTDKSTVIRKLKRMVGKGLVIRNECPTSRAVMFKQWKAGLLVEAAELKKRWAERDAK